MSLTYITAKTLTGQAPVVSIILVFFNLRMEATFAVVGLSPESLVKRGKLLGFVTVRSVLPPT